MSIKKHGKRYQINYRCPGYPKIIFESFDSLEEAELRLAEISLLKKQGKLLPPLNLLDPDKNRQLFQRTVDVKTLLEEYVKLHGLSHWSDSTMSCNLHRINDYILPYIGECPIAGLTTRKLEHYYQSLLSEPVKHMPGKDDSAKTISIDVVHKIHAILRSALNQALRWGYLEGTNPAMAVELPRIKKHPRAVWSSEHASLAITLCTDPVLKLCLLLALGCSMRIGEILGLTWDCVFIDDNLMLHQECYVQVTKELHRSDKKCVNALQSKGRGDIIFVFPSMKSTEASTILVLKAPKTESSIRNIYLPSTVANALLETRQLQQKQKRLAGAEYQDYNLVIAQDNGRPYEDRLIAKMFSEFIRQHNLPKVVFHSLRHSSTGLKLQLSGGDIKTVQGDTGHAQANMVTDVYSHIMTEDRKRLAKKVETHFFSTMECKPQAAGNPPEPQTPESVKRAIDLLYKAPQMADMLLQMAQMMEQNGPLKN